MLSFCNGELHTKGGNWGGERLCTVPSGDGKRSSVTCVHDFCLYCLPCRAMLVFVRSLCLDFKSSRVVSILGKGGG